MFHLRPENVIISEKGWFPLAVAPLTHLQRKLAPGKINQELMLNNLYRKILGPQTTLIMNLLKELVCWWEKDQLTPPHTYPLPLHPREEWKRRWEERRHNRKVVLPWLRPGPGATGYWNGAQEWPQKLSHYNGTIMAPVSVQQNSNDIQTLDERGWTILKERRVHSLQFKNKQKTMVIISLLPPTNIFSHEVKAGGTNPIQRLYLKHLIPLWFRWQQVSMNVPKPWDRFWRAHAAPTLMLYFLDGAKIMGEWTEWLGVKGSEQPLLTK